MSRMNWFCKFFWDAQANAEEAEAGWWRHFSRSESRIATDDADSTDLSVSSN